MKIDYKKLKDSKLEVIGFNSYMEVAEHFNKWSNIAIQSKKYDVALSQTNIVIKAIILHIKNKHCK